MVTWGRGEWESALGGWWGDGAAEKFGKIKGSCDVPMFCRPGGLYGRSMGRGASLRCSPALPLASGVTVESPAVFTKHLLCAGLACVLATQR